MPNVCDSEHLGRDQYALSVLHTLLLSLSCSFGDGLSYGLSAYAAVCFPANMGVTVTPSVVDSFLSSVAVGFMD